MKPGDIRRNAGAHLVRVETARAVPTEIRYPRGLKPISAVIDRNIIDANWEEIGGQKAMVVSRIKAPTAGAGSRPQAADQAGSMVCLEAALAGQEHIAAENQEAMIALALNLGVSRESMQALIDAGLKAIYVKKDKLGVLKTFLQTLSPGADLSKIDWQKKPGIFLRSTEAFVAYYYDRLTRWGMVGVFVEPNTDGITFPVTSTLTEGQYYCQSNGILPVFNGGGISVTYMQADKMAPDTVAETIKTSLTRGTFMGEIDFRENFKFLSNLVFPRTLAGAVVDPDNFVLRVLSVFIDGKIVGPNNDVSEYEGYFYFNVRDNSVKKIVDPGDLAYLSSQNFSSGDGLIIDVEINQAREVVIKRRFSE